MQIEKGMLRRVDELGRVVIPKEIRGALKIECGNLLEFGLTNDGVMNLQKFQKINEITDFAKRCVRACGVLPDCGILITDTEKVISVGNLPAKDYMNLALTELIRQNILDKVLVKEKPSSEIRLFENNDSIFSNNLISIFPIVAGGDVYGSVILICAENSSKNSYLVGAVMARFLADYLE